MLVIFVFLLIGARARWVCCARMGPKIGDL
jgi:hypothetical protein